MKKVLLIAPKHSKGTIHYYLLPMGLAYIAAVLREIAVDVKFLDFESDVFAPKKLITLLDNWLPDYIGLSVHAICAEHAHTLALEIRRRNKNIILVAGGIHPSCHPQYFLKHNLFDYVIRGDGEIPFRQLVLGEPLDHIKGLCYQKQNSLCFVDNGVNYEPKNLEILPLPDYQTIPLKRYHPPISFFIKFPAYPLLASRGCGAACTFCTSYDFNKQHRLRSPEQVIYEIKRAVKDYKAKEIIFLDPTFTYNMSHAETLCQALIKKQLPVVWYCGTSIDKLNTDLLDQMKAAGCVRIGLGIETADAQLLNKIKKPYNLKNVLPILEHCDRLGFFIQLNYMYGLPGETKETLKENLKMALCVPADMAGWSLFKLELMLAKETATPIEKEYLRLKTEKNEQAVAALFPIVSDAFIKRFFLKSNFKFYFRQAWIWRMLRRKVNRTAIFYSLYYVIRYLWWRPFFLLAVRLFSLGSQFISKKTVTASKTKIKPRE